MTTTISRRAKHIRDEKAPEIRVSLVVHQFACTADEITSVLGIKPTQSWRQGDAASYANRLPKGKSAPTKKYNTWIVEAPPTDSRSLADHLDGLLSQVAAARSKFKLLPEDAAVWVNCVVYDFQRSAVLALPNKALRAIAEMGADIDIAYYDMTDWED